jgi:ABC-2 type transport system permease protein
MTIDIKYLIAKNIPILAKINPVNMITDGLYSLYCYDTLNRFWNNTISLGIFTVCCLALSYIFVRRKKYDSI